MKDVKELVRGLQHIGIPTKEFDATIAFYGSLGFAVIHENRSEGGRVAFLRLNDLVIETYEEPQTAMNAGAIDHIALDVSDIAATYAAVARLGHPALEGSVQTLPFFTRGVSFFTIEGPNKEKVEFSQYL
ncbi:MAG: VOC family protein [Spirochaetales bacterium]|nr:VOC family protein [Spirochaetota bacterium]NLV60528.1 VOC family protein [Spirochaetales bacterium]